MRINLDYAEWAYDVRLLPGVVAQPLPDNFAILAAYGDFLPSVLALSARVLRRPVEIAIL